MGRASRRRAEARTAEAQGVDPRAVRAIPPALMQPHDGLFVERADGGHRWAAIATYTLTDDECLAVLAGRPLVLDLEHMAQTAGPLCLVCEQAARDVLNAPCAGDLR